MLQLPGNCRAGNFSVSPANWKSQSAKVNSIWKISYWFYDDTLKQKKKIVIKGGNRLGTLKEKQDFIREMIDYERDLILVEGYNHITKSKAIVSDAEVTGATAILQAFDYSFSQITCESKSDLKSALKYIKKAIITLHYDRIKIADINLMHISKIMDKATAGKSNSTWNHYKAYMGMLYKPLLKTFAVTVNPVRELENKKETRLIRQELTREERGAVRRLLSNTLPNFWRFVNIFFHSGSRETEMIRLRKPDIDLAGRRFKVLVKKGNQSREQWRPIKDIVYSEWEFLYNKAGDQDYIFSKGLLPGPKMIREEQLTRRWRMHVKKKLGIKADLYSLKHTNLDEISGAMVSHEKGIKAASAAAGHTAPVITMKVYTQGEEGRRHDTIRQVSNEF